MMSMQAPQRYTLLIYPVPRNRLGIGLKQVNRGIISPMDNTQQPQITSTLSQVRDRIYQKHTTDDISTVIATFPVFMLSHHEHILSLAAQNNPALNEPGAIAQSIYEEINTPATHSWHPLITTEYEITAQGGGFDTLRIYSTHVITHSDFPDTTVNEIATSFTNLYPWEAWSQFFTSLHDITTTPEVVDGTLTERYSGWNFLGHHPVATEKLLYTSVEQTLGVIGNTRNVNTVIDNDFERTVRHAYTLANVDPSGLSADELLIRPLNTIISGIIIDDMADHIKTYIGD
jgi:hypothetical protein